MSTSRRQFLKASAALAVAAPLPSVASQPSVAVMTLGKANRNGRIYVRGTFELPRLVPLYHLDASKSGTKPMASHEIGVGENPRIVGDQVVFDLRLHDPKACPYEQARAYAVRTCGHGHVAPDGTVTNYVMTGLMLTETPA